VEENIKVLKKLFLRCLVFPADDGLASLYVFGKL
jgi:hypothetical protein